jgi:hypothetical protein
MATKFATQTYGKKDSYGFVAADLIPNFAAYTGRATRTEDQIEKMVISLLRFGQEQDFTYRLDDDRNVVPITGHIRILAADRITKRKMKAIRVDGKGEEYEVQFGPDNPFVLTGRLHSMNALEAVIHTFVENDGDTRTPTNDMDAALLIRTLSETFNLSDAEIAKQLNKLPSWVSTHKALLSADSDTQKAIGSGEMNFAQAQAALKVPAKDRKKVIEAAKAKNGGKLTAAGINAAAREAGTSKAQTTRSLAELKLVLKPIADGATSPEKIRALAIWDFLAGRGTDQDLIAALGNTKKASA